MFSQQIVLEKLVRGRPRGYDLIEGRQPASQKAGVKGQGRTHTGGTGPIVAAAKH